MHSRQLFFHHAHKNMKNQINIFHVETIKRENHVLPIHQVCKCSKRFKLRAEMNKQRSSDIAHSLDVPKIWPQQRISKQHIFKWLVKFIAKPENIHLRISSVQIIFDDFCIFTVKSIFFRIFLAQLRAID
jgi:hypothetical protein